MINRIYIRVDGGAEIGLGHLVRSVALAQMLKNDFEIWFIYLNAPDSFIEETLRKGFFCEKIYEEQTFFTRLTSLDIVVLDGYHFPPEYQAKIKQSAGKLVCIDDLHEQAFLADLIINHAPGILKAEYRVKPYSQFALGLDFALLRPAFLERARISVASKRQNKILICFGGSDYKNLTLSTLELVQTYPHFTDIIVITGAAYAGAEDLNKIKESDIRLRHYHAIGENEMVDLIAEADLAIVPASGILLETLAVGNKIISGMYVNNQSLFFENYLKMGLFSNARDFSSDNLKYAIDESLAISEIRPSIIDGNSSSRILKLFKQLLTELRVQLRRATDHDVNITYEWASNKKIRGYSFNQAEISLEEHTQWFFSKIHSENCYYYLIEHSSRLIGSIRFDVKGEEAVISYLVSPEYHNKGLGIIVLKMGLIALIGEKDDRIKKIIGFVMPENVASCKAFDKFSFQQGTTDGVYKYWLTI